MALRYSTAVSIIYFTINIIFMSGLAHYVYKSGSHTLKSKSYLKDVWNQRKIYFPLIIHFYDTATDIGVIYNWAELMEKEADPDLDIDYISLDMKSFFWCGITFLIVYRVGILMQAIFQLYDGDGEWYYVLLVLLDLYIFVVVYESFNEANGVLTKNAQKRRRNAERKAKERQEEIEKRLKEEREKAAAAMQPTNVDEGGQNPDVQPTVVESVEFLKRRKAALEFQEVEPGRAQMALQLLEAVTESMPQIVLQSVFLIRSGNHPGLGEEGGSNVTLLLFSVMASLLSISNKFVWLDKHLDSVRDIAKSLKPRRQFPLCVEYWYIVRALWRLFHVFAKFAAFTLIWTVLGGAWLPMWVGICYICWTIIIVYIMKAKNPGDHICTLILHAGFFGLMGLVAIVFASKKYVSHFKYKCIETTVAFTIIIFFATVKFECNICADPTTRMLFNNDNYMILVYVVLGIAAHVMDIVLYLTLYFGNVLQSAEDDAGVIYHNRWGRIFGPELKESGDPFKHLISNHRTERITGIRLSTFVDQYSDVRLRSIEFQVNGVWRGINGSQDPQGQDLELILSDDEWVNEVQVRGGYGDVGSWRGLLFATNHGNSIGFGIEPSNADRRTLYLGGDGTFKLVDCKGKVITYAANKEEESHEYIGNLRFLFHKID
eukprot:536949_1